MKNFKENFGESSKGSDQNEDVENSAEMAGEVSETEKPKTVKFREHEITIPPEKKKEEK